MSLLGLAIIGRRNEPLYLCDCVRVSEESKQQQVRNRGTPTEPTEQAETHAEGSDAAVTSDIPPTGSDSGIETLTYSDPFGFREQAKTCSLGQSLSMDHCFRIHAALDHVEEMIETTAAGLPVPKGRTGHWLGLLSEQEQSVYGHITATNIKFLVLVEPPVKETDIRLFLNVIHDYYITYTMNPFSKLKGPIQSQRFDDHIREAVRDYEGSRDFDS